MKTKQTLIPLQKCGYSSSMNLYWADIAVMTHGRMKQRSASVSWQRPRATTKSSKQIRAVSVVSMTGVLQAKQRGVAEETAACIHHHIFPHKLNRVNSSNVDSTDVRHYTVWTLGKTCQPKKKMSAFTRRTPGKIGCLYSIEYETKVDEDKLSH